MIKKLACLFGCIGFIGSFCYADLTWQTPVGTIGIPLTATEALMGYDAVNKQAIGGLSLPVYTDPKDIVSLQVGAVAPWPVGSGATIQPYIAAGHDIAREIPGLSQFTSIHANIFGRYVPDMGKAGIGLSFSYSFAGGTPTTTPAQ